MRELLAIGSVVTLDETNEMYIIIGYSFQKEEDGQMYDYAAFPYPIGFIGENTSVTLFNDDNIKLLCHEGFSSVNHTKYLEILEKETNKVEEASSLDNVDYLEI